MCPNHGPTPSVTGTYPAEGAILSLNHSVYRAIVPRKNTGMDTPSTENPMEIRSALDRGRSAATIPIGRLIASHNTAAPSASWAVTMALDAMIGRSADLV